MLSFEVQSSVSSATRRSDIWQMSSSSNDVVCTTMRSTAALSIAARALSNVCCRLHESERHVV